MRVLRKRCQMSEYLSVVGIGSTREAALRMTDAMAADYFDLLTSMLGRLDRTIGRAQADEVVKSASSEIPVRVLSWRVDVEYRWDTK